MREEDVILRRDLKFKLKEERAMAEEAAREREKLRQNELEIARAVSLYSIIVLGVRSVGRRETC